MSVKTGGEGVLAYSIEGLLLKGLFLAVTMLNQWSNLLFKQPLLTYTILGGERSLLHIWCVSQSLLDSRENTVLGLFFQLALYQQCLHPNVGLFVSLLSGPEHSKVSLAWPVSRTGPTAHKRWFPHHRGSAWKHDPPHHSISSQHLTPP